MAEEAKSLPCPASGLSLYAPGLRDLHYIEEVAAAKNSHMAEETSSLLLGNPASDLAVWCDPGLRDLHYIEEVAVAAKNSRTAEETSSLLLGNPASDWSWYAPGLRNLH